MISSSRCSTVRRCRQNSWYCRQSFGSQRGGVPWAGPIWEQGVAGSRLLQAIIVQDFLAQGIQSSGLFLHHVKEMGGHHTVCRIFPCRRLCWQLLRGCLWSGHSPEFLGSSAHRDFLGNASKVYHMTGSEQAESLQVFMSKWKYVYVSMCVCVQGLCHG